MDCEELRVFLDRARLKPATLETNAFAAGVCGQSLLRGWNWRNSRKDCVFLLGLVCDG